MKPRTEVSMQLYHLMVKMGYPKEFSHVVTLNLNTDWTARRMIGYLGYNKNAPLEQVADEMLAILDDRNRIMKKKDLEEVNAAWNVFLNTGFDDEDDLDEWS